MNETEDIGVGQGDVIANQYELGERLGQGAFGNVYLANDKLLNRQVAIKFLTDLKQGDTEHEERFLREARYTAQLKSKHTVKVLTFGKDEAHGLTYMVMDLVVGKTLKALIGQRTLTQQQCVQLMKDVLHSLNEAHEHGLIHRDLKPGNIMISPSKDGDEFGFATVLDYGISKSTTGEDKHLTMTGDIGPLTMPYAAPEQFIAHKQVRPNTDLYALGLVARHALCGRLHFDKSLNQIEVITSIINYDNVVSVPEDAAGSAQLHAIINKLLQKKASHRYQSGLEVLRDLDALDSDVGSSTPVVHINPLTEARTESPQEIKEALEASITGSSININPLSEALTEQVNTQDVEEAIDPIYLGGTHKLTTSEVDELRIDDKHTGRHDSNEVNARLVKSQKVFETPAVEQPVEAAHVSHTSKTLEVVEADRGAFGDKPLRWPLVLGVVFVLVVVSALGAVLSSKQDKVAPRTPVGVTEQKTLALDAVKEQGQMFAQYVDLAAKSIVLDVSKNAQTISQLSLQGYKQSREKNWKACEATFNQLVTIYPSADVYTNLATCCEQQGKYLLAKKYHELALKTSIEPYDPKTPKGQAFILTTKQAIAAIDKKLLAIKEGTPNRKKTGRQNPKKTVANTTRNKETPKTETSKLDKKVKTPAKKKPVIEDDEGDTPLVE